MIYIECDNDHSLMKFLGLVYRDDFKHPDGKGGVLRSLKNTEVSLGIVDADGGSADRYPQLSNYELLRTKYNHHHSIDHSPEKLSSRQFHVLKNL